MYTLFEWIIYIFTYIGNRIGVDVCQVDTNVGYQHNNILRLLYIQCNINKYLITKRSDIYKTCIYNVQITQLHSTRVLHTCGYIVCKMYTYTYLHPCAILLSKNYFGLTIKVKFTGYNLIRNVMCISTLIMEFDRSAKTRLFRRKNKLIISISLCFILEEREYFIANFQLKILYNISYI